MTPPLSHVFTIGRLDNGKWLAVSTRAPYFCLEADSEQAAEAVANRALSFYFGIDGQTKRREAPGKSLSTFRAMRKVSGKELAHVA